MYEYYEIFNIKNIEDFYSKMNREKNGRFAKKILWKLIYLPYLHSLNIQLFLLCFFPCFYLLIKFNVKNFLENGLSLLFGPGECDCPKGECTCSNQERPY